MLLGSFTADDLSAGARVGTFLFLVVLPAAGGGLLLNSHFRSSASVEQGRQRLRAQTQEAEVLRLAREREGKLTVLEVVAGTGMDSDTAETTLTSLVAKGLGDLDLDQPGAMVYDFSGMIRREPDQPNRGGDHGEART